jgi:gluconolactonase
MKPVLLSFLSILLPVLSVPAAPTPDDAPVVRLDPALDDVISTDTKLVLVRDGFGTTEGPNWIRKGDTGYLVFTDIAANVIYKLTADGQLSVIEDHAGYTKYDVWNVAREKTNGRDPQDPLFRKFFEIGANGLSVDARGRIIVATYFGQSVERIEKDGKRTVLADHYEGKRFGGPNDVVVKRDGAIYFSDNFSDTPGRTIGHVPSEQLVQKGIYMIKDGRVSLVVRDIPTPNGLAFSPDEKYLFVNGSASNYIRRYEVQSDDTVANGQLLIDLSGNSAPGITDGMRVDSKGNIYSTGPGGIWIISPAGRHLGTIRIPNQDATNLCFGDTDYKTLYITDRQSIYKIRVNTPGNRIF